MKLLKKEIRPILELLAAVLLGVIVIPLGFIHNIVKPFVDAFKFKRLKPLHGLVYIIAYYFKIKNSYIVFLLISKPYSNKQRRSLVVFKATINLIKLKVF